MINRTALLPSFIMNATIWICLDSFLFSLHYFSLTLLALYAAACRLKRSSRSGLTLLGEYVVLPSVCHLPFILPSVCLCECLRLEDYFKRLLKSFLFCYQCRQLHLQQRVCVCMRALFVQEKGQSPDLICDLPRWVLKVTVKLLSNICCVGAKHVFTYATWV